MCDSNGQTFRPIAMEQQEDGRLEEQSEQQRLRSEYNQTLLINRLPFEVMEMILNEVSLNDLLVCERVCQRWNDYVRELNIRRMIIAKVPPPSHKNRKIRKIRSRKWFFIDTNDWWPRKEMPRTDLEINLNDSFLLNLRQLRVCDPPSKSFKAPDRLLKNADFINQLIHLEVLEISRIEQGTIDLPNLTCLAIHRLSSRVRIDCPKLTSYRTKDGFGELPRFLHPQTVTHLYAVDYSPAFAVFNSLKYLSLESSAFHNEYGNNDADQFLTAFPKLRVLSQRPGRNSRWNEQSLQVLLRRKNALKRDNLTIIFFGVPIDDPAQLDEINAFRLLMRNYEKRRPEELKLVTSISYSELMFSVDHKPEQLPDDIQRTFCNVQRVTVRYRVEDEDALLRFLAGLQKLRIVYFVTSSWLSEAFFEKLAAACPPSSHKCLELHFEENLVSFDFIFKFGNLVCLKLFEGALKDEFIRRVFDEFDTFELFFFDADDVCISRRDRRSSFDYSCSDRCQAFDSLDVLLQENALQI